MKEKQSRLTSAEEQHVEHAIKLLVELDQKLPGFKIRRLLEQQTGLHEEAAVETLIEAGKRLTQRKYAEGKP